MPFLPFSSRAAYNESVLLGQEITKKINDDVASTMKVNSDEDSSDSDEGDSKPKRSTRTALKMKAAMDDDVASKPEPSRYDKLLDMDFMKKAAAKQKERAK